MVNLVDDTVRGLVVAVYDGRVSVELQGLANGT